MRATQLQSFKLTKHRVGALRQLDRREGTRLQTYCLRIGALFRCAALGDAWALRRATIAHAVLLAARARSLAIWHTSPGAHVERPQLRGPVPPVGAARTHARPVAAAERRGRAACTMVANGRDRCVLGLASVATEFHDARDAPSARFLVSDTRVLRVAATVPLMRNCVAEARSRHQPRFAVEQSAEHSSWDRATQQGLGRSTLFSTRPALGTPRRRHSPCKLRKDGVVR